MQRKLRSNGVWRDLVGAAASFGVYFGVGRATRTVHRVLQTPIDRATPFLPWTVYPYVSLYPLLIGHAIWLLHHPERLRLVAHWMMASNGIAGAAFWLHQTDVERPTTAYGVGAPLLGLIWRLDPPTNALPSLHTTYAVLIAHAHHRWQTHIRWLIYGWCAAIIASTLTTKQHYVLDVLAGILLASTVIRVQSRICEPYS